MLLKQQTSSRSGCMGAVLFHSTHLFSLGMCKFHFVQRTPLSHPMFVLHLFNNTTVRSPGDSVKENDKLI